MTILENMSVSFVNLLSQRADLIPINGQANWNPPDINNLLTDGDIFLTPFILLAVIMFFFRKWSAKPNAQPQKTFNFIGNESDPRNDTR